ncbi:MAG: gene transfer agent family protein [Hyphomicrobiaceae bacterium]
MKQFIPPLSDAPASRGTNVTRRERRPAGALRRVRPKRRNLITNHHRGEVEAILDGRPYNLCLTLGALAELEATFGDENMLALAQRFEGGKLSARDCVRIIGAGLRGAGHDITDEAVARMQAQNGIPGFIDIVARLLIATFGSSPSPRTSRGDGPPQAGVSSPPPCGEGLGVGVVREVGVLTRAGRVELSFAEVPAPVPFPGPK